MTKMIAGHLTKADEKALYLEILEHCPEGYVKDILTDMGPDVHQAIDSDFGFVSFREMQRHQEEQRRDMDTTRAKLAELKTQVRELEATRHHLSQGLDSLRADIRKFARL